MIEKTTSGGALICALRWMRKSVGRVAMRMKVPQRDYDEDGNSDRYGHEDLLTAKKRS